MDLSLESLLSSIERVHGIAAIVRPEVWAVGDGPFGCSLSSDTE